ncbi:hypothetical protein P12x_003371 [Tundrisphaera lichenicola]|uniref:hypothetical protein n=1 Tax=Tundrisphaera lichenicola TaxID=2029860 RepID=UPI003EB74C8E
MSSLGDFLRGLLKDGQVVFRERPIPSAKERPEALAVLESAFADHRLDLAGPSIEFDGDSALLASEFVRQACWFLIDRSEPVELVERVLILPARPSRESEHLSADLTLRFLPQVLRRARSIAPGDRLGEILGEVLRGWPLSGVLSDVEGPPDDLGSLGSHPGLLMLYAERLADHEKPGWMPSGLALDYVEMIYERLGKARPAALRDRVGVALG